MEQQRESLEIELENTKQRESISKDQTKQVLQRNHQLQEELLQTKRQLERSGGARDGEIKTRDELISKLETQIRELELREGTGQEEVARCRAQVASLSAELSVERQMLEETREQLAISRVGSSVAQSISSLPSSTTTLPIASTIHYNSLTNKSTFTTGFQGSATPPSVASSTTSKASIPSTRSSSYSAISSTLPIHSVVSSTKKTNILPTTSSLTSSLPYNHQQPVSIPILSFGGPGTRSGGLEYGLSEGGRESSYGSIVSDVDYLELPSKQAK